MKTYFSDVIPKFQRFSQKLDNLTLLTNQHWVVIDEIENSKNVYIFRKNNELLISQNGKVTKAKWEYLGNNSLLIEQENESYLFKHGFFDENILALKIDSKNEYAFLVNENKFEEELNSKENIIDFLSRTYISSQLKKKIQDADRIAIEEQVDYTAPTYKVINKKQKFSVFNGEIDEYSIEYEDGVNGDIYVARRKKQFYFKAKPEGYWINFKYVYSNFDSCINALHFFIKNGKELKAGFVKMY